MCLIKHCQSLLLLLSLCSTTLNVASYSQYDARFDPRRVGQNVPNARSGYYGPMGNRQQPPQQNTYQRPPHSGGNYEQEETGPQPISREYLVRDHETIHSPELHKCRIWVPKEVVSKYPWAQELQIDATNRMKNIEVCCTGYTPLRFRGVTFCRPICGCQNGVCSVPGECTCHEGFVKNDNGDCVFACPLGCQNGRCFLDGSCQCDQGYTLDETRRFCRPICSNDCGNNPRHNCTEPEVCSCANGYQLTNEGCTPFCDPDCGIGGICRDNNICSCGSGYKLKDGVCQTDCYQKCINGICVSRNRCICDPGFTYHEQSTHCVPV